MNLHRRELSQGFPDAPEPPPGFYARHGKRLFDLALSAVVFVVFGWLMLVIAVAIRLEDGGAVLYRQERIGAGGRAFLLTKFRSMVKGAEHKGAGILVERNDVRITRVGRVIRKLSLDELAQIFDVVRGDMSIVGPRPGLRYQAELYDAEQRRRLAVRPGITGWAQINGRNAIRWPERIRLDLEYIERISFALDVRILLRTLPALLSGSDQIADADYWKLRRQEMERARGKVEWNHEREPSGSDPSGNEPGRSEPGRSEPGRSEPSESEPSGSVEPIQNIRRGGETPA